MIQNSQFRLPLLGHCPTAASACLKTSSKPCVSNSFRASPSVNFTHTHSVSSALIVRFKMVEQHISIIVTKGSAISGAKRGNGDSNEEDQHEGHEETVHHSHRHGGRRSHGARRLRLVQFFQQLVKRLRLHIRRQSHQVRAWWTVAGNRLLGLSGTAGTGRRKARGQGHQRCWWRARQQDHHRRRRHLRRGPRRPEHLRRPIRPQQEPVVHHRPGLQFRG